MHYNIPSTQLQIAGATVNKFNFPNINSIYTTILYVLGYLNEILNILFVSFSQNTQNIFKCFYYRLYK